MKTLVRFGRRDNNHTEIVKGLRKCGYKVMPLQEFDALCLGPNGKLVMLEIKSPGGKPTPSQQQLVRDGWPLVYVESIEQALEAVGSRDSLDRMRRAGL